MSNQFEDKELECVEKDCPNENAFVFGAGEQQFFHDKGYYTPKRCADCRKRRQEEKAAAEAEQD